MTEHRQNIESAWDNLLEAVAESQQDASRHTPALPELAARLDTLHASLRGLGNAWTAIRDLFPAEPSISPDKSEVPGAMPQSSFCKPLARVLYAAGGSARTRDAISGVGKALKDKLSKQDLAPLPSTGQTRWIVNVRFARLQLRNLGLILADKTPGIWELTEAGKRWAENDKPLPTKPIPQDNPNQPELPF
mgnify:CR=1 FL=1|jgi:hypothetical protein